jgi:hypothetical protein
MRFLAVHAIMIGKLTREKILSNVKNAIRERKSVKLYF